MVPESSKTGTHKSVKKGGSAGKSVNGLPADQVVKMYRQMLRIRQFEERCYQSYMRRKIGGFCHIYSGQEAVAVGMMECLGPEDYVITAYRDHGHAIARGMKMRPAMAEMYGKATGCSRGKGGSMHFFDKSLNFMGGHAIVGAHIPMAAGIAWAIKYQKKKGVVICYFGDGAINQGAVHEGLGLAGLYKLPVIFVCENNGYAMGTAVARGAAEDRIYIRAGSYRIDAFRISGADIFEVYEKTRTVVERAKESYEPAFIEAMTYRYRGHSMSDPGNYRTKEEIEAHKAKDPVVSVRQLLLDNKILKQSDFDNIDKEVIAEVADSVEFAENSPEPDLSSVYEDIYSEYSHDVRRKQ